MAEYTIVNNFKYGYRNREDITNLPPGVLIVGSQNVLHNASDRIQIRQGYEADGGTSIVAAAILSSFDWQTRGNAQRNLRAGFLTSAGNDGKLQYRYVDSNGDVTWRDLVTGATSTAYNFTPFWNNTEQLRVVLFVNGASSVSEWNGAYSTVASTTINTIVMNDVVATAGFYLTTNRNVIINGNTYAYTGVSSSTLTGVTPDPTGEANGSIIHQAVVTTANSAMTNADANFDTMANGLIKTLNNQVYMGALNSPVFYISKFNSYTDWSFSSPRLPAEGATGTLDDNLVAFDPQENVMYISAGKDLWYNTEFTPSADITKELFSVVPLKTGKQQAAQSQAFVSHMKNNIIVLTNEPTMDFFGRMENFFGTPQTKNISDPIKLDFDSYDFTDGSIFYHQYFIYVAVPKEGLFRMYNLVTETWEAPQTIPISRFYTVDGELYGHSYNSSESYKLFTGYADRVYEGFSGFPISAVATFSYQNFGTRFDLKSANAFYVEGYINSNTLLNIMITRELDGCASQVNLTVDGSDTQVVCIGPTSGSLGKVSLGKEKLGGSGSSSLTNLPPKFRAIPTFTNKDFFESNVSFSVLGVDNRFELLAFGLNNSPSTQISTFIKQ